MKVLVMEKVVAEFPIEKGATDDAITKEPTSIVDLEEEKWR